MADDVDQVVSDSATLATMIASVALLDLSNGEVNQTDGRRGGAYPRDDLDVPQAPMVGNVANVNPMFCYRSQFSDYLT
jgi:hypothetical protein